MGSSEKNINIKLKADSKDLKNELNSAKSKINGFTKFFSKTSTASFITSLTGIGKSFSLITSGMKVATAAISSAVNATL